MCELPSYEAQFRRRIYDVSNITRKLFMSRTYKHQLKYDYRNWENPNPSEVAITSVRYYFYGTDEVEIRECRRVLPQKKDINEPQWLGMPINAGKRANYWHKWSNKRARRKAKQLIHDGNYEDAEILKPENVDWMIW